MDNGGIPSDWKPTPPPSVGTLKWKRDFIEHSITKKYYYRINKAWDCGDLGIFVSIYGGSGWSSYWINKENATEIPKIDWESVIKSCISQEREGQVPTNTIGGK